MNTLQKVILYPLTLVTLGLGTIGCESKERLSQEIRQEEIRTELGKSETDFNQFMMNFHYDLSSFNFKYQEYDIGIQELNKAREYAILNGKDTTQIRSIEDTLITNSIRVLLDKAGKYFERDHFTLCGIEYVRFARKLGKNSEIDITPYELPLINDWLKKIHFKAQKYKNNSRKYKSISSTLDDDFFVKEEINAGRELIQSCHPKPSQTLIDFSYWTTEFNKLESDYSQ